jgi:hypothetical protein
MASRCREVCSTAENYYVGAKDDVTGEFIRGVFTEDIKHMKASSSRRGAHGHVWVYLYG